MIKKLFFLAALATSVMTTRAQQTYVNLKYVTATGVTDTVDLAPIIIDDNGKVTVSGNEKITGSQYDASTSQQLSNGIMTWTASFNLSTQKCWVTSSTNDASGNIFVTGGVATGTANGVDLFVVKYDNTGNVLWSNSYNGPNSTIDVGTGIVVDGSGYVYVCGASDGTNTALVDYVTLKFDKNTGAILWTSRYNYNNSYDAPVSISYITTTGRVEVTGASGTNFVDWDVATVAYNAGTGSQYSVNRTANPGGNFDKAFSMATDSLGNVYVAGTTWNGGNNSYDISVQKLDTALNMVWIQSFDAYGFDDAGINLALDDSLYIYVTGTSYYSATNRKMTLLKYANNGTLKWSMKKLSQGGTDAEGIRVKVKSDNEIFVGGNFTKNNNQDMAILRFSKYGKQTMEKTYNGPLNDKDKFLDFVLHPDSNFIYVSGRTYAGGALDSNITLKYEYNDHNITPTTNTTTGVTYAGSEIIVHFNKPCLRMDTINDTKFLFGRLSDFVADSTCLKISNLLASGSSTPNAGNFATRKIHPLLTEADSISETRMGDYIKVPPFYGTLLITLPGNIDAELATDTLWTIDPDIGYSQLNFLYEPNFVPNDALYTPDQTSLHPSLTYPNAHINMEPAWNYTTGTQSVRVGIYDTGTQCSHADMVGSWVGGYDYIYMLPANPVGTDENGHGSKVSGVVGARTNNSIGVSGVAGGNNLGQPGVGIVDMRILQIFGVGLVPTNILQQSYTDGALPIGYNSASQGLHIMNHSYGIINQPYDWALVQGINFVNQSGVAFVAARGNYINGVVGLPTIDATSLPACLKPKIIMNVGANGTDGNLHMQPYNGTAYTSGVDKNVDFIAPGAYSNVHTIDPFIEPKMPAEPAPSPGGYTTFGGTSASAPHVSGVAGLMMSYWNSPTPNWDNLVHEDCEALIKRTATDLTSTSPGAIASYSQAVGPDITTGKGRINAGAVMAAIEKPQHKIRHIDAWHFATNSSVSINTIAVNATRYWPGLTGILPYPGTYSVDILEITTTYTYNYSAETFLEAWPLLKASKGTVLVATNIMEDEPNDVEVVSASLTGATLRTYCYKLKQFIPGGVVLNNTYFPTHPNNIKSAFTLYTLAEPESVKEKEADIRYFNVFPNPNDGNFKIGFVSKMQSFATVKVLDVSGKVVYEDNKVQVNHGNNNINLNLSHLAKGIYFINLDVETNKSMVKKLIIN